MKRVLIYAGHNWGFTFWEKFGQYAYEKKLYDPYIVAANPLTLKNYERSSVPFHLVGTFDDLNHRYGELKIHQESILQRLEKLEKDSGELIVDFLQSDRKFALGFHYMGIQYPIFHFKQPLSYWNTLRFCVELIDYFEKTYNEVQPSLILLDGVASLQTKLMCVLARLRNIPIRILRTSRIGNCFHWDPNEFGYTPKVEEVFHTLEHVEPTQYKKPAQYVAFQSKKTMLHRKYTLNQTARRILKSIHKRGMEYIYYMVHGYLRYPRIPLSSDIYTYGITSYLQYRKLMHIVKKHGRESLPEQYVFFPLQLSPEATTMIFEPQMNNQLSIIDLIIKALPVGVKLVVKEHFSSIGLRPLDFYRWLDTVPNAYVASPYMDGAELVFNSLATVTITGTPGFEAAMAGVPVITFGRNNIFNFLDHVYVIQDFSQLRSILSTLVHNEEIREKAKCDGQRFLKALESISVDLGDNIIKGSNRQPPTEETIHALWVNLQSILEERE